METCTLRADLWVDAGGTLVNLVVGTLSLLATHAARTRANVRYFFWIFAARNLFAGTGYFMFSGAFAFGDWQEVIRGWPYLPGLRTAMFLLGAGLYYLAARLLAIAVHPLGATVGLQHRRPLAQSGFMLVQLRCVRFRSANLS